MNNSQLYFQTLPYDLASPEMFQRLRSLPRPVFLDSNFPNSMIPGVDIITAAPSLTVTTRGAVTHLTKAAGESETSNDAPFDILKRELEAYPTLDNSLWELPFTGGALGYFSYDLGRRLETMPSCADKDIDIPDMDVGIYLWAVIRDHARSQTVFVARPECPESLRNEVLELLHSPCNYKQREFSLVEPFRSNMTFDEYANRLQVILQYINAGDCYQVNFAQRFMASYQGDEWDAYLNLRASTDAPFSGFIQSEDYTLLSLSPERFVQVRNGSVETKPIKGTRPRSDDVKQDQQYQQLLRNSTKDQAENLMIVDLLRNDISKNCSLGSVNVPKLFDIESYSNVHHLVSTVKGRLAEGRSAVDLLSGSFPGGSITGAPKLRAMEIIEELEPQRRAFYCGSLGYIDFNGNMDTNIAIRSLICHNRHIYCWGGGGIVADSDVDNEYQESYVKVSNLLKALSSEPLTCMENNDSA